MVTVTLLVTPAPAHPLELVFPGATVPTPALEPLVPIVRSVIGDSCVKPKTLPFHAPSPNTSL